MCCSHVAAFGQKQHPLLPNTHFFGASHTFFSHFLTSRWPRVPSHNSWVSAAGCHRDLYVYMEAQQRERARRESRLLARRFNRRARETLPVCRLSLRFLFVTSCMQLFLFLPVSIEVEDNGSCFSAETLANVLAQLLKKKKTCRFLHSAEKTCLNGPNGVSWSFSLTKLFKLVCFDGFKGFMNICIGQIS